MSARISVDVHDARLSDVVALLSIEGGRNVVADDSVGSQRVTLHLSNVTFDEALAVLVASEGLLVRRVGGTLIVGTAESVNRAGSEGGPLGARTEVFALLHGRPEDVAKALVGALPAGTVIVPDERTDAVIVAADPSVIERARSLIAALDAALHSDGGDAKLYRLRYVKSDEALKMLKTEEADAVAVSDDAQNALIVRGDDTVQRRAAAVIAAMDRAGPQVAFEVRVADITPQDDTSNVGFEFGGTDSTGQAIPGAATYAFAQKSVAVNARLNAMITHGRAQILATPRLVALNNHEADLLIGQTYPIATTSSAFSGQQVQFVDVGVKLRLTPTIGDDGSVTAEIHPEYSEIEGFAAGNLPIIANRKIDSTLRVGSDQTIVLGGLMRDVSSETITKLPGLADIPILGAFFRNRATTHQRNEIVFLITPHVIQPGDVPPSS